MTHAATDQDGEHKGYHPECYAVWRAWVGDDLMGGYGTIMPDPRTRNREIPKDTVEPTCTSGG